MKRERPARVLMLLENNSYPNDVRVRKEAQALILAGYQVSVISPGSPGQPSREIVDQVAVYRYPAPSSGDGFIGYLREYGYSMAATLVISFWVLLRRGFDVIHAANPPDTFVLIAALYKLLGKKFVFDHHDLSPEMYYARFEGKGSRLVYGTLLALEKLSCRLADHVIATNQSYKLVEMSRGGVPPERVTIVRNGPELSRLELVEADLEPRADGKCVIAFAGVMGYQDGVDYLLRALRHLLDDLGREDFLCLIIGGKGDARESLQAMAARLRLDDHVRFTGWVSEAEWNRLLRSADICVDPDPSNPFTDRSTMIKMTEYMAAGRPIVAFDLPEHRFTAGEAAEYVRPNDELEFARSIARMMDDPARRERMGQLGRKRIEDELAWDYSAEHLKRAYEKLLAGAS